MGELSLPLALLPGSPPCLLQLLLHLIWFN